MRKHFIVGLAALLLLVGAGCSKTSAPAPEAAPSVNSQTETQPAESSDAAVTSATVEKDAPVQVVSGALSADKTILPVKITINAPAGKTVKYVGIYYKCVGTDGVSASLNYNWENIANGKKNPIENGKTYNYDVDVTTEVASCKSAKAVSVDYTDGTKWEAETLD